MHHSATARSYFFAKFAFAALCAFIIGLALFAPTSLAADNGDPFLTTDELCIVTLTPTTSDVQVNGTQTLTATVTSSGLRPEPRQIDLPWYCSSEVDSVGRQPLGGVEQPPEQPDFGTIDFDALSGPNAGLHSTQTMNPETGQAQFTYSSTQTGTDIWVATAHLPDVCFVDDDRLEDQTANEDGDYPYDRWVGDIPSNCVDDYCFDHFYDTGGYGEDNSIQGDIDTDQGCDQYIEDGDEGLGSVGPPNKLQGSHVNAFIPQSTPVKSNQSSITWFPLPVVAQINPSVHVSSNKKCHRARSFHIRSAGYNGTVASTTIYIDHKKYKVHHGSGKAVFKLLTRHYHPGKHNVKIVTTFTNGKTVTTATSFKRCPIKVARKSPRFTG